MDEDEKNVAQRMAEATDNSLIGGLGKTYADAMDPLKKGIEEGLSQIPFIGKILAAVMDGLLGMVDYVVGGGLFVFGLPIMAGKKILHSAEEEKREEDQRKETEQKAKEQKTKEQEPKDKEKEKEAAGPETDKTKEASAEAEKKDDNIAYLPASVVFADNPALEGFAAQSETALNQIQALNRKLSEGGSLTAEDKTVLAHSMLVNTLDQDMRRERAANGNQPGETEQSVAENLATAGVLMANMSMTQRLFENTLKVPDAQIKEMTDQLLIENGRKEDPAKAAQKEAAKEGAEPAAKEEAKTRSRSRTLQPRRRAAGKKKQEAAAEAASNQAEENRKAKEPANNTGERPAFAEKKGKASAPEAKGSNIFTSKASDVYKDTNLTRFAKAADEAAQRTRTLHEKLAKGEGITNEERIQLAKDMTILNVDNRMRMDRKQSAKNGKPEQPGQLETQLSAMQKDKGGKLLPKSAVGIFNASKSVVDTASVDQLMKMTESISSPGFREAMSSINTRVAKAAERKAAAKDAPNLTKMRNKEIVNKRGRAKEDPQKTGLGQASAKVNRSTGKTAPAIGQPVRTGP